MNDLESTIYNLNDEQFFNKPDDNKWSIAENVQHLILCVNPINLALGMPLILLKIFGSPNNSRAYEEIVAVYLRNLRRGKSVYAVYSKRSYY